MARIVRSSHERFDGTGYPDGLEGERIPLESRIVFCADAFHAIRSDRPYRRGTSARKAIAEVRRNAGTQFDPVVAKTLDRVARDLRMKRGNKRRAVIATVDSRRLAALLAALTLSGGALAATGNLDRVVAGGGDKDKSAAPASGVGEGQGTPVAPAIARRAARRARAASRRRAARRRAADRAPAGSTLGVTGTGDSTRGQPPISGHDNGNGKSRGKANGHAHAPGQLKRSRRSRPSRSRRRSRPQPPPVSAAARRRRAGRTRPASPSRPRVS